MAPAGTLKEKILSLTKVSGIFGAPPDFSPPRLTTPPGWLLKKLITVSFDIPAPLTVMIDPSWLTELTMMRAPTGAETALLFRVKLRVKPPLLITKEPGPVVGELGKPAAGKLKLTCVGLSPGLPGLTKNGPTLP